MLEVVPSPRGTCGLSDMIEWVCCSVGTLVPSWVCPEKKKVVVEWLSSNGGQ